MNNTSGGKIEEENICGGTEMRCLGFKGGIGPASEKSPLLGAIMRLVS